MSALDRLKEKNATLRQNMAKKAQKMRKENQVVITKIVAEAGGAAGAVGCAFLDDSMASDGEIATFGDTEFAIAPVGGAVLMVAGLVLSKAAPEVAAFLGGAGSFGLDLGIYDYTRRKLR